jgi:DNA-binding transcriptional LysR family regulator
MRSATLDLRMVRQFLAVAESLSFRKAAEQMHMAQPPLSQAIMRLEALLRTQLFERSSRGVRLTPAGDVFRQEAVRLLNQADRAMERVAQAGRGELGRVDVAFIGPTMFALLPRVIHAFQQRHPGVELGLHEGSSIEVARLLDTDSVDIGFLLMPTPFESSVAVEEIVADTLTAALPAGHRLSGRRRIKLAELAGDTFVLFSARGVPGLRAKIVGLCEQAGFAPRVVQEAVQISTVLGLVAGGLGVSLLPGAVQALAPAGVIYKPIDAEPALLRVTICAAYRKGRLSGAAQAFLATARDCAEKPRAAKAPAAARSR